MVQPELVKVFLLPVSRIELTDEFPQHVVCEWLGNSEKVAEKHYLHVTDEHMSAACGYSTEENVVSNVVSNVVLKSAIMLHQQQQRLWKTSGFPS